MENRIEVIISKNGMKVPIIDNINIHSIYDPEKEGEKIIKKSLKSVKESSIIVILGLGFGYHLQKLIELETDFIVFEPNIDLIDLALENNEELKKIKIISSITKLPIGIEKENIIKLPSEYRLYKNEFNKAINHLIRKKVEFQLPPNNDLRILIDFPIYGGSMTTAKYLTAAFEDAGYFCKTVDNSVANELFQKILSMEKSFQHMLSQKLMDLLSDIFWIEVEKFKPDVIIFNAQSPITDHLLNSLKKKKIPTVFWFVEDFRRFPYWQNIAPKIDFFFTIQQDEFFDKLNEANIPFYDYLPMAAAKNIHKTIELTDSEKQIYGSDISFMGAGFLNRHKFFSQLTEFDLKIWGNGWENNNKLKPFIQKEGQRVSIEETVMIYNASKININLHSSMDNLLIDKYKDFVNPRTFEIAACGGFQIVDRRELITDTFIEETEIVCFDSVEELKSKISYYLTHKDERDKIAKAGQKKVLKMHTYSNRIEQIMKIVSENSEIFRKRISKKMNSQEKLLSKIDDPKFIKFWNSLNPEEKTDLDLIEKRIDENRDEFEEYEVILKILKTFQIDL